MENLDGLKQLAGKRWVIGVSGGGDSMALLDLCRRSDLQLHCAHVNYHHRDSADRDQHLCERYCAQWSIPIHILHAHTPENGNFQANARRERYAFYRQLCDRCHCDGVLVAHQQDDVLETYLMQKQRGSIPSFYGLREESEIFGVRVIRPLLACTRSELRKYCHMQGVPYEDDESNDSDDYERNRVRHHQLEKMSEADRRQLLAEMEADNVHLSHLQRQADAFLASWDGRLQPLLSHAQNAYILQHWVRTCCGITLSHSAQRDLLRRLRSDKPQWTQPLDDRWQLKKEYARVVLDTLEMCGFSYTYDTLCYVQTDHFSLCPQGERIEGVTLKESDFPITIRNARSGDAIVLRFGTKKLSRWFIDRHIPQDVRRRWPVMVNAQGTVIFVPKIGCDITHFSNNPNVFMIQ